MPEGSGNNEDGSEKKGTDVLDSSEVKDAIAAAVKEAEDKSYRKGQSDQNKATQTALDAAKTAQEKIDELEKSQFDSLSDDDKQKRMVETLYKERNPEKKSSSEQQEGTDSNDDAETEAEKTAKASRTKLEEAVTAEGLDLADVDMDHGTVKFVQSLMKAKAAKKSDGEDGEDNTEGKGNASGGPVDKGGGSPAIKDITKADPEAMFRKSYKGGS